MPDNSSERNPIDLLAEEFAERCRQGAAPSIEEYAAKYPQLADDIRNLFPPVAMMEELKRRRKSESSPIKLENLGEFRIVRELGRGGMGIVYEAQQTTLARRVALKVLPRHSLLDDSRLQRFKREARAAAQLHHTNIVPVFGNGECDGLHYYVMQYIEGQPLNTVLVALRSNAKPLAPTVPSPKVGPLYWRWVANVGVQISEALNYAHKQGILHRDIKPANILLDVTGAAWVTDFGLAKVTAVHDDLTQTGDLVGTLQYMAPEVFDSTADARSDIYSLGLVLGELLTLKSPFADLSPARLLNERANRDPLAPRKINPAIPRDLENVVLKASAALPEQRYQSGAEFADDLRRFIDDRPVVARAAGPLERLSRWCRRNRAVAALSAVAIGSLLLALISGWVGYVKTTEALARESQRRIEADNAKRKADENVQISLQAFEQVFHELEPDENQPGGPPPLDLQPRPGPDGRPERLPNDRTPHESKDLAVLQSVLSFYNQFAEKNDTNTTLQFEAAKALGHVADIQIRLGELDKAEAACKRALSTALDFCARDPKNNEYLLLAARSADQMGMIMQRRKKSDDAEKYFRQSLEIFQALEIQRPDDVRTHVDVGRAQLELGMFFISQQRYHDAAATLSESTKHLKEFSRPDQHMRGITGDSFRLLAEALKGLGDNAGAARALEDAKPYGNGAPRNRPPPRPQGPPPRQDFDQPPPPPPEDR